MTASIPIYGKLRHRFWGAYSAVVGMVAQTEHGAKVLVAQLPEQLRPLAKIHQSPDASRWGVTLELDSEQVSVLDAWADKYRVDEPCCLFDCRRKAASRRVRHPIGSTAHNIDYGPDFDLDLPVVDIVTPLLPFPETPKS